MVDNSYCRFNTNKHNWGAPEKSGITEALFLTWWMNMDDFKPATLEDQFEDAVGLVSLEDGHLGFHPIQSTLW